jgi:hypothetical protein
MAPTIDVAFVEEYNADVHLKFRQLGSRLMNTTRKGTVMAKSVYWQVFGTLTAQTKTRNAQHTFQDPEHTRVKADMADWYVPTLIDDLDMLKLNIDEKNAHAQAHVSALGKKADQIIIDTMEAGANSDLGDATKAFDFNMAMAVVTTFQVNEVPDDGRRFCALHPYAWSQLLKVPEFANADYVGQEMLPFKGGMTAKFWMGVLWMPLPNIYFETAATGTSGGGISTVENQALNIAWHQSVVGHGVNKEIETNWDWENTYSAWSAVSSMSLGSAIIEDTGCYLVSSLSPQPAA